MNLSFLLLKAGPGLVSGGPEQAEGLRTLKPLARAGCRPDPPGTARGRDVMHSDKSPRRSVSFPATPATRPGPCRGIGSFVLTTARPGAVLSPALKPRGSGGSEGPCPGAHGSRGGAGQPHSRATLSPTAPRSPCCCVTANPHKTFSISVSRVALWVGHWSSPAGLLVTTEPNPPDVP